MFVCLFGRAAPCSMRDHTSLARNHSCAPLYREHRVLTPGLLGKSLKFLFITKAFVINPYYTMNKSVQLTCWVPLNNLILKKTHKKPHTLLNSHATRMSSFHLSPRSLPTKGTLQLTCPCLSSLGPCWGQKTRWTSCQVIFKKLTLASWV